MRASCWVERSKRGECCPYQRRFEDPACNGCALQLIDDKGHTPEQAAIRVERARINLN